MQTQDSCDRPHSSWLPESVSKFSSTAEMLASQAAGLFSKKGEEPEQAKAAGEADASGEAAAEASKNSVSLTRPHVLSFCLWPVCTRYGSASDLISGERSIRAARRALVRGPLQRILDQLHAGCRDVCHASCASCWPVFVQELRSAGCGCGCGCGRGCGSGRGGCPGSSKFTAGTNRSFCTRRLVLGMS